MSEKVDGKADGSPAGGAGATGEIERLTNSLRFEKAKNEVLLGEVIALEDAVVNRCMADFDSVVSDETREFWRQQLLTNRSFGHLVQIVIPIEDVRQVKNLKLLDTKWTKLGQ